LPLVQALSSNTRHHPACRAVASASKTNWPTPNMAMSIDSYSDLTSRPGFGRRRGQRMWDFSSALEPPHSPYKKTERTAVADVASPASALIYRRNRTGSPVQFAVPRAGSNRWRPLDSGEIARHNAHINQGIAAEDSGRGGGGRIKQNRIEILDNERPGEPGWKAPWLQKAYLQR